MALKVYSIIRIQFFSKITHNKFQRPVYVLSMYHTAVLPIILCYKILITGLLRNNSTAAGIRKYNL